MRRNQQDDFGLVGLGVMRGKQLAQQRQVAQTGNLARAAPILVIDQACQNLCFTIFQTQYGVRIAGADLVGERAVGTGNGVHNVRDFQPDFNTHIVVQIHGWFDIQLQTHVQVTHRLRYAYIGGAGGANDGHFVANKNFCFLLVHHPDARIGENLHVAILFLEVQLRIG